MGCGGAEAGTSWESARARGSYRYGSRGMVLNPSGDLGDRGVLHATCEGDVGEGWVPPGGKVETWFEVAGVRLQEGGLTHTGDATQAQLRVDKGLTDEVRSV